MPGTAHAQQAPAATIAGQGVASPAGGQLDDIIVTARRRAERNQDVPISIIAVGQEQLKDRGITTVLDIQNVAAGFKAEPQNNRPSTLQITIRGQRMYGILAAQDSPTAFYFADALALPTSGLNNALYDLASVQVLKGPQGTLFGRNTTGGALVITPARPTDRLGAEFTATYGNYATAGFQGFLNVPLAGDFLVRVAGAFQKHGSYQHVVTPGFQQIDVNDDNARDLRLSAIWRPSGRIENYLIAYYDHDRNGANIPQPIAVNPNGSVAALYGAAFLRELRQPGEDFTDAHTTFRQFDHARVWGVVDTANFDIGSGLNLKNIFSYRHVTSRAFFDVTGSDLPLVQGDYQGYTHLYTEELQLQGKSFGDRLTWVAGGYYMDERSTDPNLASVLNPTYLPARTSPVLADVTNRSLAAYAQATFKMTDRLQITAGARYTKDIRGIVWRSQTYFADDLIALGLPNMAVAPNAYCALRDASGVFLPLSGCRIAARKSFAQPTWTISLDYHPTPDTLFYVTNRRGYRSGGWNQRAVLEAQRLPFGAETVMDYEAGVKADFAVAGWKVRLNAAGYYDRYKNLQRSISQFLPGVGVTTSTFNAAAGHAQGAEIEFAVKPSRALTVGGNYALVTFRYTSFPYYANGAVRDFSDRKLAGVPKNQLTIYGQYDRQLPEDRGTLTFTGNMNYVGGSYFSEVYQSNAQLAVLYTPAQLALLPAGDRPFRMRPYKLVNLRAEWKGVMGKSLDVALYARNLFNVGAEIFNSNLYDSVGSASVGYGPPRTYGLQLTYRWDR